MSTVEQTCQLTVRKGPQPGKVYPLIAEKIIVGRDPMSDIALNDPEVSRQHAQLVRTESGYSLEDLGSTNGTFIDGEQLDPGDLHALRSGQIVSMGSGVTLLYEATGAAAEDEAEASQVMEAADDFATDATPSELRSVVPRAAFQETAVPSPQREPATQTPLVTPGDGNPDRKRRRNIILAVVLLVLLCCCFLVFLYTGFNYWGDLLYEYLLTLLR